MTKTEIRKLIRKKKRELKKLKMEIIELIIENNYKISEKELKEIFPEVIEKYKNNYKRFGEFITLPSNKLI